MRLALPSLIIFAYVYASLILFIPCRFWIKLVTAIVLLSVSQKYLIYQRIGHSFMAPNLPSFWLHLLEISYAVLLILFFLLLIKDILLLALWVSHSAGVDWKFSLSPPMRNLGIFLVGLVLASFGHWQSLQVPKINTVEIQLPGLPREMSGFSLIQLTDIHIGPLFKGNWLENVVARTNLAQPDLITITGDFIDGSPNVLAPDIAPLGKLTAKYGVYGVTGNHEYYFGADRWLPVLKELGITMLHNEHRLIADAIILAGVPDRTEKRYGGTGPDVMKAFSGAPHAPRILLAHQPDEVYSGQGRYLQLSGHTHGGHLFFMKWLISRFNGGLVKGLYHLDDKLLYVSPGTGLWAGFACRLGVPAEITRFILKSPETESESSR